MSVSYRERALEGYGLFLITPGNSKTWIRLVLTWKSGRNSTRDGLDRPVHVQLSWFHLNIIVILPKVYPDKICMKQTNDNQTSCHCQAVEQHTLINVSFLSKIICPNFISIPSGNNWDKIRVIRHGQAWFQMSFHC